MEDDQTLFLGMKEALKDDSFLEKAIPYSISPYLHTTILMVLQNSSARAHEVINIFCNYLRHVKSTAQNSQPLY
jgi:hypothetical protein